MPAGAAHRPAAAAARGPPREPARRRAGARRRPKQRPPRAAPAAGVRAGRGVHQGRAALRRRRPAADNPRRQLARARITGCAETAPISSCCRSQHASMAPHLAAQLAPSATCRWGSCRAAAACVPHPQHAHPCARLARLRMASMPLCRACRFGFETGFSMVHGLWQVAAAARPPGCLPCRCGPARHATVPPGMLLHMPGLRLPNLLSLKYDELERRLHPANYKRKHGNRTEERCLPRQAHHLRAPPMFAPSSRQRPPAQTAACMPACAERAPDVRRGHSRSPRTG